MSSDKLQTSEGHCDHCDSPLPLGCGHFYGNQSECKLGPRTDKEWRVGLAVWDALNDRRGVKHALQDCDLDIQIEIVETMGRLAIEEMSK